MKKVLISAPYMIKEKEKIKDLFKGKNVVIDWAEVTERLEESDLISIIGQYDGIICGDDRITQRVLKEAVNLKVIAKWGIGVDGIDLDAARQMGIKVLNTPNVFADEVADVVMGYIVLLARQLHKLDNSVRNGGWLKIQGISLYRKKLGVIGVGSIGRAVVRRAKAAGMVVIGYDAAEIPADFIEETGLLVVSLEELLQSSDFISLNCILTQKNHHMLSFREFDLMKNGVYIINTARGPLIDEAALVQALKTAKVAGAALDVFEQEPLQLDSPLREFGNCIFGTHNSSNTFEAIMRVNDLAIQNLLNGLGIPYDE